MKKWNIDKRLREEYFIWRYELDQMFPNEILTIEAWFDNMCHIVATPDDWNGSWTEQIHYHFNVVESEN